MSKKARKTKHRKNHRSSGATAGSKKSFSLKRRHFIQLGVLGVLSAGTFVGVSAYIEKQEVLHDLSIIGQGKPVLVQVHDPKCPRCQTLLSSVESVLKEFPEFEFRIANIKTGKGSVFASRRNLSNVTLLVFNESGKQTDVAAGLQTEEEVRAFLERNS